MVAARGGDDAGRRHCAAQQIGEGAARLERTGVLQEFELEEEGAGLEAEIGAGESDDRGAADVRPDQPLGCGDPITGD